LFVWITRYKDPSLSFQEKGRSVAPFCLWGSVYDYDMTILVTLLATVLSVVAIIHALWGIGVWFPIRDEERLVKCVVGAADATRMPGPIPCALVSAGLIVVVFSLVADPNFLRDLILGTSAIVFLLRGILTWLPMWRRMTPQQPFAKLDQMIYGPTCSLLGIGIAIVLWG